jgi:preprotein translocase subunit SecD
MRKKDKTLFWGIVSLSLISLFIALPRKFDYTFKLGGQEKRINLSLPSLNISLGPIKLKRDLALHRGLDLSGGAHLSFEADLSKIPSEDKAAAMESLRNNVERRVNLFGLGETVVQTSKTLNKYRLIVEIPGDIDPREAAALVGQTAQLEFKEETPIPPEATKSATIFDQFAKPIGLTGAHLRKVELGFSPETGKPEIRLEFTDKGKAIFARATKENVGKRIGIFLDNFPLSLPVVQEPILDGRAVISGNFTLAEAKQMVSQLNAGALPVPVSLVEQRRVSASLGEESIRDGVIAGLVGVIWVALFMILFYGRLGVLAVLGILIYGILSMALYKVIPVVLTMSGVAGFLLSLGMAVDSNILIFERMREEVGSGKPWRMAMELGFGRAWDSIRDANVCTLITCFVLFNPFNWSFLNTSGMVRGFAATLGLGVLLEMFTGIIVVRTIMRVLYKGDNR